MKTKHLPPTRTKLPSKTQPKQTNKKSSLKPIPSTDLRPGRANKSHTQPTPKPENVNGNVD